jgi:tRNA(fMet)-specific endonuclease VapC
MEKNRVILDTSAYSLHLQGDETIKLALQRADEIVVNPVILGELLAGFHSGGRVQRNRDILRKFLASSRVRIVDLDEETAERFAVVTDYLRRAGLPIPTNDLWIAASAMQHGLKVLTADAHFLKVPQIIAEYVLQR